jgi:hypothetical protein
LGGHPLPAVPGVELIACDEDVDLVARQRHGALLQDDLARGSPKRDAGVKVGQVGGIGLAGKGSAIDAGDQPRALRHTTPPADTASRPEPIQSVCREGADVIKVVEFVRVVLGAVLAELLVTRVE